MATTDEESRAWVVITVGCVTMSFALLALACRVFTRIVLVKHFGPDDWAAVVAAILMLTCGLMVTIETKYGLGRHFWTVSDADKILYFKHFYTSIIFYNATLVVVKIAFLLQYYRVFAIAKVRRLILYCTIVITGWSLSQLLVAIFTCTPIHKFWDRSMDTGTCIDNDPQWYINAAGNITTDTIIFCLPLPVLKNINLQRTQKLIVMGIFSLGFFTVAISLIRIKYLHQFADLTWHNIGSACWSVGEIASAVTCLCLPTLRPLLGRLRPRRASRNGGNGGNVDNVGNDGNRSKWSSVREFFHRSTARGGHRRTRSDRTHTANGGGRNGASQHSKNTSQDTTVGDGASPSAKSQDGSDDGRGRDPGQARHSPFDIAAARRAYLLPLPDCSQDPLRFPDSVVCRDVIGLQGTVTTTIGSERSVSPTQEPREPRDPREPPDGHIAVHYDMQREFSPWCV